MAGFLLTLSACGGGGSESGATGIASPTTSPVTPLAAPTYPLQAAYKALITGGSTENFTVSGDCTGTAQMVNAPAIAASFEGTNGFASAVTSSLSLSNCTANSTLPSVQYFNADFAAIGSTSVQSYSALDSAARTFPVNATVGDSQPAFLVFGNYADSTRATRTGYLVIGYSIEEDIASPTTNTVLFRTTSQSFDNASNLQVQQKASYRLTTGGTLKLISVDLTFGSLFGSTHLVYTRVD